MRPEQVLTGLNDAQVRAVTAPAGPLAISAGAGTGKTRTVTARIAYRVAAGDVQPAAVLAVTHSTRAAGNLRDSLRAFSVSGLDRVATRTVHAAALNQLRFFWQELELGGEAPVVCSDQFATVRDVCRSVLKKDLPAAGVSALLAEIAWAKASLLTPGTYVAAAVERRTPVPPEQVAAVFERYETALRKRRVLDHTDLLTGAARLIEDLPEVAREVRRRVQFLVVDEYQDTDPAQQRLIDAWLGDRNDVTVVGDSRQAIYAFKGSDPRLLASFCHRHPDATQVDLTVNYRSSPQILDVANRLAAALAAPHPVQDLTPVAAAGPAPSVRSFPDLAAETRWVAGQLAGNIRAGMRPGQAAVLVRDNARAREVSDALEACGVPSWVSGGTRFFDAPEITAVRTQMRQLLDDGFDMSGAAALRTVLADAGFDRDRAPQPGSAAAPVWRSRRALLEWVEALPSVELLGAPHLLQEMDRAAAAGHQAPVDAVFVGTVHAAKGLEFDSVHTLGWDSTWRPHGQEGNLAYVALTRARRQLTLTWAERRADRVVQISSLVAMAGFEQVDERTHLPRPREPEAGTPQARRAPRAPRQARCRRCRTDLPPALAVLGECAAHLTGDAARRWADLMSWRADRAVLESVPARRVLSDAVALALIAQLPRTARDLLDIPGIGPATVRKHGHELLALLASA